MSTNFNWDQFEEVKDPSVQKNQSVDTGFDWNQFEEVNPKRTGLEKTGRIGSQLAIGAAQGVLFPYEVGVKPLSSEKAQHAEYRKELFSDIERLQEQKQMGEWDDQDQELYDSLLDQIKNPEKAKQFVKTADIGARPLLEKTTGLDLQPEGVFEKGANILGNVAGFPGGIATAFGSIPKAAGTAALALTTPTLEESGVNPWLALGGGIVADVLTRGGIGLGKKVSGAISKGIPQAAGTLAGKAAKLSPDQVKQGIIEAGERIGISQGEIPLSAQLSSPVVQGVETKLRESSLAGRSLEKQLGNVESKVKTAFEDIANNISNRQGMLPNAVAEEAITQLKDIEQKSTQVYQSFYNQATKNLPKEAASKSSIGKGIINHLQEQVVKLGQGAGTPAKDAIRGRMERLLKDWKGRFPDGNIPISDLIELKKDLNQIIKYEVKGGVDKMLTPLSHMTKNAIQEYGRSSNKPFLNRFNEAEKHFSDSAQKFRKNNAVESLLKTQNPEQILNKMRNVKTYRELKKLFERTPDGKAAFADLSKYLLEDMIGSKLLNKNGNVSWGNASGMLKDPKKREIIREILGKESFDKLKDIQKISSGIEEGLRKFANSSGTATKGLDIALILGTLGKGLGQIFSGNVISGAKSMSYLLIPRTMAKLMANPKFVQSMVDVAHAGRGNNPDLFLEAAQRATKLATPALLESYSVPQEPDSK